MWKPWGFHLGVNVYCFVSVERGRGPAPLHVRFQPSGLVGTLPAGGAFWAGKRHQNPLRAFPPKDLPGVRGWACVKAMFGPSPLLWLQVLPPHQATLGSGPYGWVISTSGPTLAKRRSRRRGPGFRQLGTVAYQGKALAIEVLSARETGTFCRISMPSM